MSITNNPTAPEAALANSIRLPKAFETFLQTCKRPRARKVAWYFIATSPYPDGVEPSEEEFRRDLRHWQFATLDKLIAARSREAVK